MEQESEPVEKDGAKTRNPPKSVERRHNGVTLPAWLLGGMVSCLIGVGGAGFTMWRNDSVQDNKIDSVIEYVRQLTAADHDKDIEIRELRQEIASNKKTIAAFADEAINRLKILAEQDRFRSRK